jgi:AraC-like DNA-binding protein
MIHRLSGRSRWRHEQPELFAAGLALSPAQIELSGDSRFAGVRLWPWAWRRLGGVHPKLFVDDWIALDPDQMPGALLDDAAALPSALTTALQGQSPPPIALALLAAQSPGDAARRAGVSLRGVQRWCRDEIGLSPQAFLRLLRLDRALRQVQDPKAHLAGEAADLGFADQPHMNREFRLLARSSPARARRGATGPFLPGDLTNEPAPDG